jgi:hypothetical protein
MKSSNKTVITNAGVVRTKVALVFFAYDILNVGINSFTNGSVNLLKQFEYIKMAIHKQAVCSFVLF